MNFAIFSYRRLVQNVFRLTGLMALFSFGAQPVFAEGPQDFGEFAHGVNRVVRTNSSGYIEVEGTVDISFDLPAQNVHDNSPSVYFGGTIGGVPFDAGLQYEAEPVGTGEDAVPPGWLAFIRGGAADATGYTSPRVWGVLPGAPEGTLPDNVPWRGPDGSIESLLRLEYTPGGAVSLHVGAMVADSTPNNSGTFFHYPRIGTVSPDPRNATAGHRIAPYQARPTAYFTTADRTTANVKRVIAMTRANTYNIELDGATMTAVFSGGSVRRYNETTNSFWQSGDVNQGNNITGYDAPGNGAANRQVWDMRFRRGNRWFTTPGQSRSIVEFPSLNVGNIEGRTDSAASRGATEGGNSRYTRETVRINLRRATGAGGVAAR